MSLKKMTKEDLELMSYKDITNLLLEENGAMNTKDLFTKIVELLELPKKTIEDKIADYYMMITTDKRFIMLEDGNWDLRNKHTSDKVSKGFDEMDEDEEESEEENNEDKIDSLDEEDEEDFDIDYDSDDDEDLKDLIVMDEEELELEE